MRNFGLLLLSAFMVLNVFTSCSDDDDDKKEANNNIVGQWKFQKMDITKVITNSTANDKKVSDDISKTDPVCAEVKKYRDATWNFKEDGTIEFTLGNKSRKGTYRYTGGRLEIFEKMNEDTEDTTYYRYQVNIINGVLIFEYDFTNDYEELELDEIISLGITDTDKFEVLQAGVNISYQRQ